MHRQKVTTTKAELGWACLGGLLVGWGLRLVSDTSDRPGQQEVMPFCFVILSLDANDTQKFPGPPDRNWAGRHG